MRIEQLRGRGRRNSGSTGPQRAAPEPVPDAFVATVAMLGAVAIGLAVDAGEGRGLEAAVAAAAVAAGYLVPARVVWVPACVAVALYLAVEAAAGRLDHGRYWIHVAYATGLVGATLGAGYVRRGRELREAALARATAGAERLEDEETLAHILAAGRSLTSLEREIERSRRHNHRLSLLVIRPDDADEVVGRYGKPGLDLLLNRIADAVGEHLRTTDVAVPLPGIQFCAVLPETPVEGARVVAERVRLDVAARPLQFVPGEPLAITVSVGVAGFPADATTNDALTAAAERALARASELGGNRTVLASSPPGLPPGWSAEQGARLQV